MCNKAIYTHDEAALIVEIFENILSNYGIKLPSPEDDERELDNEACLYGSTYSELLDNVEVNLINMLQNHKNGCEVIKYVFSGTM